MAQLRVSVFGSLEIEWGPSVAPLDSLKAQELFAYLLLHRGRSHPRESLAAMLWPEQDAAHGRQYLRKALWQVQSRLHGGAIEGVLTASADEVSVCRADGIWLDAEEFEAGCAQANGVPGRQLDAGQAGALRRAIAFYRGELLEGWYAEWCLLERERLHTSYVNAASRLIGYCEANGEYEEGIALAQAVLRYDRAREHTHRALMRLLYLAGDRTGALRQFERCATTLREDLDVAPAAVTIALADQIRDGGRSRPGEGIAAEEGVSAAALLPGLRRLQETLQTLQKQLAREVEALDGIVRHSR